MSGKVPESSREDPVSALALYSRDGVDFIKNWIIVASKIQEKDGAKEIALILTDRRGVYESDAVIVLPATYLDPLKDDDFVYWTLQEVTHHIVTVLKMEMVTDATGFWTPEKQ